MNDSVAYGPDLPSEHELRLLGDLSGKRVLELGSGDGHTSVALAAAGARVITIEREDLRSSDNAARAEAAGVKVEWREGDLADLAFLRADSIDLACSVLALAEVDDLNRVFRQVHRVLHAGSAFVFSYPHPTALSVGREIVDVTEGALPLGPLQVLRAYSDPSPVQSRRAGRDVQVIPRTVSDLFGGLGRAGFRVEVLLELEALTSELFTPVPSTLTLRARKEGI